MSAAAATADPPPQSAPSAGPPSRFAPLLSLVRKLIDYGKQLAASLQPPTPTADLDQVASTFGSYDLSQIVASIIRGLHRAAVLEAKLARLDANPPRQPEPAGPSHCPPRAAASATPRAARAVTEPALPLTPEQFAAQVRRRPIGAVLADICRDLGILPCHPLWRELQSAIIEYGGSLARLFSDICQRPWLDHRTRQPVTLSATSRPLFLLTPALAATAPP